MLSIEQQQLENGAVMVKLSGRLMLGPEGARLEEIMEAYTVDEKTAMKKLAKEMGVSKSEVYRELQRQKA